MTAGGQSTFANNIDFEKLSKSLGFKKFYSITNTSNIKNKIKNFINVKNPSF